MQRCARAPAPGLGHGPLVLPVATPATFVFISYVEFPRTRELVATNTESAGQQTLPTFHLQFRLQLVTPTTVSKAFPKLWLMLQGEEGVFLIPGGVLSGRKLE